MSLNYDKEEFYRAHLARDPRFDGKFFVAVKTTMIYCRPICPARKAKLENLECFIHTAQAEEACEKLLAIKGVGPWTVEYIAMRALRNPNAFPETDLVLKKKIEQLQLNPQKWTPWRGYGAILLWNL